jgi:PhnB protein
MRATPFLYFKGDCESALQFYQSCGLGEIVELRRIEGTPLADHRWVQEAVLGRSLQQLYRQIRRAMGGFQRG